jgi:hypothetical protein
MTDVGWNYDECRMSDIAEMDSDRCQMGVDGHQTKLWWTVIATNGDDDE